MTSEALSPHPVAGREHAAVAQLAWFAAGALLAFLVPLVFTSMLDLHHDAYYVIYFAFVLTFVAAYVTITRIDLVEFFHQGLILSLIAGALVAAWMVFDILSREDGTPRPDGAYFAFELVWRGVAYGAIDAILLTAFPALVAFAVLRGRVAPWADRARFALITLALSIVITATYHLGYEQYREDGVAKPEIGNVMLSIPTLVSANPAGSIVAHSAMHVAAVSHSYEGDRIPPHTEAD